MRSTCDPQADDSTGMPINFVILPQSIGRVMVEFYDNSLCENVFTLVRYTAYEEFSQGIGDVVNIANYKTGSDSSCESAKISPYEKAMDDQRISKLIVGYTYIYCIQAGSDLGTYMPSPYDTTKRSIDLNHSERNCLPHTIRWEGSYAGIVTTEPHAGTLPVDEVEITYQLLSLDLEELNCNGCSGTTKTTAGGSFFIEFNVDHPYLKGVTYKDEVPVRILFSKTTKGVNPISHSFLCNWGEDVCDKRPLYLKHLEFDKILHIYDSTQVLFTGTVYVQDTAYPGARGCGVSGAEVALMHLSTDGQEEELVRVTTDASGYYEANVVLGTVITEVKVMYHSHEFAQAQHNWNNYREGLSIDDGKLYNGNDFEDISKSKMTLEIAGGNCDYNLGIAKTMISIMGCKWQGKAHVQNDVSQTITNIPAAVLEVRIVDFFDSEAKRMQRLWEFFSNKVRTINLLDIEGMKHFVEKEKEKEDENGGGGAGTASDNSPNPLDAKGLDEFEKVRFQYDGELMMTVNLVQDADTAYEQPCYIQEGDKGNKSFWVINYMTIFAVEIKLKHELIPPKDDYNGLYCSNVDSEKYKVNVESNLGMDGLEGFCEFWEGLKGEPGIIRALEFCSPLIIENYSASNSDHKCLFENEAAHKEYVERNPPCQFSVKHNEDYYNLDATVVDKEGNLPTFATGRPNPFPPYTRNMFFSVTNTNIQHTAEVFIDGLYTKGPGNSIAIPTFEPVMILRDPPGGLSSATYENIVTTTKLVQSGTTVSGNSHLGLTIGAGASFEGELCTGGGMGAIVLFCSQVGDAEFEAKVPMSGDMQSDFLNEEYSTENSITTTWVSH